MAAEQFSVTTAAKLVGCVPATLRAWDRNGLLKPARDAQGARLYTIADIHRAREIKAEQRELRLSRVRDARSAWHEARRA
jgi:DNA-binding transcriptional MerR regulator